MSGFRGDNYLEDTRVPSFYDPFSERKGVNHSNIHVGMDGQDWTTVTIKKKPTKTKTESVARQSNTTSQRNNHTHPLSLSGKTIQPSQARKLAESTDVKKPKTLSSETLREISYTRNHMGLTQLELNKKCQFPMNTIRDIESGKISPTPQQMDALSRELKIPIRYARN